MPADAILSAITLGELQLGLLRASAPPRTARDTFIQKVVTNFLVLPFGHAESLVWADLFENLRSRGLVIGERDLLIAATAIAGGHAVMTFNTNEFSRVPGLELAPPPAT